MASQSSGTKSNQRKSGQRKSTQRRSGEGNSRRASEKTDKYRFAQNVGGAGTAAEHEYERYAMTETDDPRGDPDVLLDVPVVKVDSIHLEVDDLDAHVALQAKVLDLVRLNVGVDVHLGKLRIDIKGVEAQALLKVRLDYVTAIVDRVLTTLDRNPELLKSIGRTVEHVGEGAGHALGETGEAVEQVGEGAQGAVGEIGSGAGQAVGDLGQGAGQAVGQVGEGAGQAVGDIGQGAGQAVGDVGEGAGQAVGNLGQTVEGVGETAGQAGQAAGQAVGQVGEGVGEAGEGLGQGVGQAAGGVGQAAGGLGQAAGGLGEAAGGVAEGAKGTVGDLQEVVTGALQGNGGDGGAGGAIGAASAGDIAKLAAKIVAQEIKSAAADEAKELGLAATRKAIEVGEKRKQRKAEELNATEAALREAEEHGIDLDEIEGSGPDGRITIRDVKQAQEA
jgi:2-oxoacid dehydrogenase-like protein with E3 subunit-binding domain